VTANRLLIDIETRSVADLKKVGIHNYACDPTTSITHVGFTFDGSPIEVWQPRLSKMPGRLRELVNEPATSSPRTIVRSRGLSCPAPPVARSASLRR
jgi:hypothetical protein